MGVPLAVCLVFWYTPRSRLPASAGLVPLAALACGLVLRDRFRAWPTLVALSAGALFTGLNGVVGFDQHDLHERRHAAELARADTSRREIAARAGARFAVRAGASLRRELARAGVSLTANELQPSDRDDRVSPALRTWPCAASAAW